MSLNKISINDTTTVNTGIVYDISKAHNGATYTDLADALGSDGENVPLEVREGGMSIRFVSNSDNKYVQYRLMSTAWSNDIANWQGVDDEPTAGSDNLVKSGGVYKEDLISQTINSSHKIIRGFINAANQWDISEEQYFHFVVPISPGDTIRVDKARIIAFLTSYDGTATGPSFCSTSPYDKRIVNNGQDYIAPNDAKYLFIETIFESDVSSMPTSIYINGYYNELLGLINNVTELNKDAINSIANSHADFAHIKEFDGHINGNNRWSLIDNGKHIVVSVNPNDKITVNGGIIFAVLRDYKPFINGDAPMFSTDANFSARLLNKNTTYTMPFDAKYFVIVTQFDDLRASFNYILINGYDITRSLSVNINDKIASISNNIKNYFDYINYGATNIHTGIIDAGNKWDISKEYYTHFVVPISPGDTIRVDKARIIAFLTSYDGTASEPSFCSTSPYDRRIVNNGQNYIAPSDAKFLFVETKVYEDKDTFPTEISINGYNAVKSLSNNLDSINININSEYISEVISTRQNSGIINSLNHWDTSKNYYYHIIIPINNGDAVKVNGTRIIAFFRSYNGVSSLLPDFSQQTGFTHRIEVPNGITYVAPSDAKFLFVETQSEENVIQIPTEFKINGYDALSSITSNYAILEEKINNNYNGDFSRGTGNVGVSRVPTNLSQENKTIFDFNPNEEFYNKINQLKRFPRNVTKVYYNNTPVVLAHFSDIHGQGTELSRIVDFCTRYDAQIDDILFTGDAVQAYFDNDYTFWTNIAGAHKILFTVGNHECMVEDSYSYTPRLDVYNKFIAPFVQEWNVVQPVDAATLGLNYYYKDYITSSFRLVVIDIMYWDADENTWLQNTLADARINGLDVAIACHYPPSELKKYGTPFQTIQESEFQAFDVVYGNYMSTTEPIQTVQEFIDNGGNFAVWIVGHVHDDFVGVLKKYPNQLCIAVTASACNYQNIYDSAERVRGTKSQDAFNIVGIDTYNKTIKVVRVGSNYDSFMRKKDTMCIKYSKDPELLY